MKRGRSREKDDPERQHSFLEEEISEERREAGLQVLRWSIWFVLLFTGVFLAFWWSGAAVRFGASRVVYQTAPTYRVWGIVRSASSHQPVPWARIDDDPFGRPPLYHADADRDGAYALLTLAEPHKVRISANGYKALTISVGRQWFAWWPKGEERRDLELWPESP